MCDGQAELCELAAPLAAAGRLRVLCCGNPSRGDDAVGPGMHRHLAALVTRLGLADRVRLVEDFQWQIEAALELYPQELVLFVDAAVDAPFPYRLSQVVAGAGRGVTSHALSPAEVLAVADRLGRPRPVGIWQLAICGRRFTLGAGLSAEAEAALRLSTEALEQLIGTVWGGR